MYLIIDLFVLDFQPNDSLSHLHKHVFGPHIESTSKKKLPKNRPDHDNDLPVRCLFWLIVFGHWYKSGFNS